MMASIHIGAPALAPAACTKETSRHDPALQAAYRDKARTMDRPGLCGCDGTTHRNDRIARQHGIPRTTPGPCN